MDEKTLFLLGEIKGNQEAQGKQIDKIEDQLKETNANVGRIAKICAERAPVIEQMEEHARSDKPVEQWVNEKAARLLYAVLGGAVAMIAAKMPVIVGFLFAP